MLGLAAALGVLLSLPADALGAVERVNYRAESPDGPRTFFDQGGLLLRGSCQGSEDLTVEARTKHNNALISHNVQSGGAFADEDLDLDVGESHELLDGNFLDSTSGQIVYARPGGKVVTIDWSGETEVNEIVTPGGDRDCGFFGAARVVDSGAADRINFRADAGEGPTTVLSRGGLTLTADCDGSEELTVEAASGVDDAMLHANQQDAETDHDAEYTDNLDEGDPIPNFLLTDDGAGQLIYARPDGKVVTVDFAAQDDADLFGNTADCAFVGTARVRDPGDPKLLDYATSQALGVSPFNTGGLELKAACPDAELITRIRSHADDSIIHANTQTPFEGALYGEDDSAEDDGFDEHPLFGAFDEPYFETNNAEGASGQLIFAAPNGTYVTIDWLTAEDFEPFDGQEGCAWLGTAEVVSP